ncbi:MAG: hypothetical protein KME45_04460 [Stenomitos rutilans HA7619-LM2]|nr:hypothetical protein [Stenomitos rutilans HA7619-LM2]
MSHEWRDADYTVTVAFQPEWSIAQTARLLNWKNLTKEPAVVDTVLAAIACSHFQLHSPHPTP